MDHDYEAHLRALWNHEPAYFFPATSYEDFRRRCQAKLAELTGKQRSLIQRWLTIGTANPWIREAHDPPFTILSFEFCRDVRHLADRLLHGNWCLGQAFALDDICFINQIDGGDEWLTIKSHTPFESITMRRYEEPLEEAQARLFQLVERIRTATEEQCRRLRY